MDVCGDVDDWPRVYVLHPQRHFRFNDIFFRQQLDGVAWQQSSAMTDTFVMTAQSACYSLPPLRVA